MKVSIDISLHIAIVVLHDDEAVFFKGGRLAQIAKYLTLIMKQL